MPIDFASMAAVGTSLKTAFDMTKAMIGIRDAAMIQAKIIELQGIILSAQSDAFSAQSDQFALLERIRQLEKEVADMKAWDAAKEDYALQEISPGAFAYVLKPETGGAEPPHWLCTACYHKRKKSILQFDHEDFIDRGFNQFICPDCKSSINVRHGVKAGL
jgi:hypothetical protein